MIGGVKTSTMIAHFPLDIACERGVIGDQGIVPANVEKREAALLALSR
jgi:hypothetical protein